MISPDELKLYLPKYLSAQSEEVLFEELKRFPNNIDKRVYTTYLKDSPVIYQGDGLQGLLFVRLPESKPHKVPAIVLSNTCDVHPENLRLYSPNIVYSPIWNLEKYQNALVEEGHTKEKIKGHINDIRKQRIFSIFYLPQGGRLEAESLVFFDHIACFDAKFLDVSNIKRIRLFTLSDYGFYLFVFKLAVHFTRIQEKVDRRN